MKKVGNITSNRNYNPQNKKPPVPVDVDEADSAMERFIRQKYVNKSLIPVRRDNTSSSESDDNPPPLPPKPASRFGFRSASSIFPLGSRAKKETATRESPSPTEPSRLSPRRSKVSQIFGATVNQDGGDGMDYKLAKLRDMGFYDDQRNATILKGVNWDLDRTVETLVRLGERRPQSAHPLTVPHENSTAATDWPSTPARCSSAKLEQSITSDNPFDMLDMPAAQPQSSQSTGTLPNKNPYTTMNPLGLPVQQTGPTLSLSPSQQLFPHHTGDAPPQHYQQLPYRPSLQQLPQQQEFRPIFQQPSVTYPIPSVPAHGYIPITPSGHPTSPSDVQSNYNPFFANQQSQQSLGVNTAVSSLAFGGNPFTRSPTRLQSPLLAQIPEQSRQDFCSNPSPQGPVSSEPQTNNPFLSQPSRVSSQPAGLPSRPDKASILALYDHPCPVTHNPFYMAPQDQNLGLVAGATQKPSPVQLHQQQQPQQPQQQLQQAQPAVISQVSGNNNPFLSNLMGSSGESGVEPPSISLVSEKRNADRDSLTALGHEWSNGRHSPDAFASLSARHMR